MSREELFRRTASEQRAHLVEHLFLGGDGAFFRQIPCRTERLAARDDAHLDQRIGMLAEPADGGMAGFVDGDGALLLGCHHLRLLLQTAYDTVDGIEEVLLRHVLAVVAGRDEGRLIADVGNVGAREARRLACEEIDVEVPFQFQRTHVDLEDRLALGEVGQIHVYLPVEASGTEKRLVEHVDTVGRRKDDDAGIGPEAVHLGQEGVEGILPFVVSAHGGILGAGTSHGIDLVDEDNAGGFLFGLPEHVAHTARTDTDEHLHEVGAAHGEERHPRLAGDGLCQEGLARSRGADEQRPLGDLAAQVGIFLRVLQELDNLLHLLLGSRLSGYVLEGDAHLIGFLVELGLRLSYIEDPAGTAGTAAHAPHEEVPDAEEQQPRSNGAEDVEEGVARLVLVAVAGDLLLLHGLVEEALHLVYRTDFYGHVRSCPHLLRPLLEDVADVVGADVHAEGVGALVDNHLRTIPFGNVLLEGGVVSFYAGACGHQSVPSGKEHHSEGNDDEYVEPVHVELRHIRLVVGS